MKLNNHKNEVKQELLNGIKVYTQKLMESSMTTSYHYMYFGSHLNNQAHWTLCQSNHTNLFNHIIRQEQGNTHTCYVYDVLTFNYALDTK